MIKSIIYITLFFCVTLCYGQINYPYLIGLLGDNNGKIEYLNEPYKMFNLSSFGNGEKSLEITTEYLNKKLGENNYKIFKDSRDEEFPIFYLNSKLVYSRFCNFYKISKKFEYEGEDENLYEANYLILKNKAFRNEFDRESFLIGSFERNGGVLQDDTFFILYVNSISHYKVALKFLKRRKKSEIIRFYSNNESVPTIKIILFKPSEELKIKLLNSSYSKLSKCGHVNLLKKISMNSLTQDVP